MNWIIASRVICSGSSHSYGMRGAGPLRSRKRATCVCRACAMRLRVLTSRRGRSPRSTRSSSIFILCDFSPRRRLRAGRPLCGIPTSCPGSGSHRNFRGVANFGFVWCHASIKGVAWKLRENAAEDDDASGLGSVSRRRSMMLREDPPGGGEATRTRV